METTKKGNLIRLSDYYPSCTGRQEYAEVSDEVLAFLIDSKRMEKKLQMRDYRHLTSFGFLETEAAVCAGLYEKSAEDTYFSEIEKSELYAILSKLPPAQFKRFYLYHAVGMTIEEIAAVEGVSHSAISKSIQKAVRAMRKYLYNNDK